MAGLPAPRDTEFSAIYRRNRSPAQFNLIASAKDAIDNAERHVLTPEIHIKFQLLLHHILDELSSSKVSTAAWILEELPRANVMNGGKDTNIDGKQE